MKQHLHSKTRLALVGGLHVLLVPLAFIWWRLGAHYVGHSFLPGHNFLVEGAAAGVCLVLVFPVLIHGRGIRRTLAVFLSALPAVLFALAVFYAVRICIFSRA